RHRSPVPSLLLDSPAPGRLGFAVSYFSHRAPTLQAQPVHDSTNYACVRIPGVRLPGYSSMRVEDHDNHMRAVLPETELLGRRVSPQRALVCMDVLVRQRRKVLARRAEDGLDLCDRYAGPARVVPATSTVTMVIQPDSGV